MKNRRLYISLLAVIVIIIIAIIVISVSKPVHNESSSVKIDPPKSAEKIAAKKKPAPAAVKKTEFQTNEEIRATYGRLEKVYLWGGQTYTGAVIETKGNYKMVTVDGLKIFQMSELKQREIIR